MKIRIRWAFAGAFIALVCIINSFAGFVGFFSFWLSVILPFYAFFAIVYLIVSWELYAWFQTYSTNHPRKGETIHFEIRFTNDGKFPLIGGTCKFIMPGSIKNFDLPIGFLPKSPKTLVYTADVACPYRGTYIAGIESIHLSTPLGLIQTEVSAQVQTFYVLPELCPLSSVVESYAMSAGTTISGGSNGEEDAVSFECTAPLLEGQTTSRIAWKKWASTGVPATIVNGHSRSQSVTIVLDLYPCAKVSDNQKLAAEDMVISAAFSLLQYFALCKIPVNFITGGSLHGTLIDGEDSFKSFYERSVNILFTDPSFPQAAFAGGTKAFLFTARPLIELYSDYEKNLHTATEPHIFLCPPEPLYEAEKSRATVVSEQRHNSLSHSLFYVANVKNGSKEITDAFSS